MFRILLILVLFQCGGALAATGFLKNKSCADYLSILSSDPGFELHLSSIQLDNNIKMEDRPELKRRLARVDYLAKLALSMEKFSDELDKADKYEKQRYDKELEEKLNKLDPEAGLGQVNKLLRQAQEELFKDLSTLDSANEQAGMVPVFRTYLPIRCVRKAAVRPDEWKLLRGWFGMASDLLHLRAGFFDRLSAGPDAVPISQTIDKASAKQKKKVFDDLLHAVPRVPKLGEQLTAGKQWSAEQLLKEILGHRDNYPPGMVTFIEDYKVFFDYLKADGIEPPKLFTAVLALTHEKFGP